MWARDIEKEALKAVFEILYFVVFDPPLLRGGLLTRDAEAWEQVVPSFISRIVGREMTRARVSGEMAAIFYT